MKESCLEFNNSSQIRQVHYFAEQHFFGMTTEHITNLHSVTMSISGTVFVYYEKICFL